VLDGAALSGQNPEITWIMTQYCLPSHLSKKVKPICINMIHGMTGRTWSRSLIVISTCLDNRAETERSAVILKTLTEIHFPVVFTGQPLGLS
jgi:hypothetical protein